MLLSFEVPFSPPASPPPPPPSPFVSPAGRFRPDTYTMAGSASASTHLRFLGSRPSSHRYTVRAHPGGRAASRAAVMVRRRMS